MGKKNWVIILTLLAFGVMLRLINLGEIPSGFFRDEAALGYNAYSIWQTGKDEFGKSFPLVFRSFEVFFLPAYVYLSAPIVGLLGLSEFSSRLLSALSGITALVIIFLIGKKNWNLTIGIFSVFLLSISPWHIFYSRGAFEGNLALTFFVAGFLFWTLFLKNLKINYFFLSTLSFAVSMYSYQTERVVVPLFAITALGLSFKKLVSIKRKLIVPSIIILILLIPLFSLSFKAGGYHRAFGVSVFAKDENPPGWVSGQTDTFLINNKLVLRAKQILSLYFSYFSPRNLYTDGDYNRQRSVENFSVLYAWYLPPMILGLWTVITRKNTVDKLLISLILFSPIPAALTGDPFHTYRSLLLYFPLTLLGGIGLGRTFDFFSKIKYRKYFSNISINTSCVFVLLVLLISSVSIIIFWFSYSSITPSIHARDWDYGYKEIVNFAKSLPENTKISIDDPATESYIHYLFFAKVDPRIYQLEMSKLGNLDTYYYQNPEKIRLTKFGQFEFNNLDWSNVRGDKGAVFIFTSSELPVSEFQNDPHVKLLKEVYYPDGSAAYRIVQII